MEELILSEDKIKELLERGRGYYATNNYRKTLYLVANRCPFFVLRDSNKGEWVYYFVRTDYMVTLSKKADEMMMAGEGLRLDEEEFDMVNKVIRQAKKECISFKEEM